MKTITKCIILLFYLGFILISSVESQNTHFKKAEPIEWKFDKGNSLNQEDSFYGTEEAIKISENILLHQRENGGWPKNYDRTLSLNDSMRIELIKLKSKLNTTIDNHSTYTEIRFLSKVYNMTKHNRFKSAILKGIHFILEAQYPNGGWPQFYPIPKWYGRHITFNDGAMIGVMKLLNDIIEDKKYYSFVDDKLRARIKKSIELGTQCILKCQIVVDGKKTAWCAQHDEISLKPQNARKYEPVSISGYESVGVVRFLMGIKNPSARIIDAVQNAIMWFDEVKLVGMKEITIDSAVAPKGFDRVLIYDSSASPIWARFYEIKTNKPIYAGSDGIVKYTLSEVDYALRTAYRYHGYYGKYLLERDYGKWLQKHKIKRNVLEK